MTSVNSALVGVTGWSRTPDAGHTINIVLTTDEFDALVASASEEVVDVCLQDQPLARALDDDDGDGHLIIETSDGSVYLGNVVDPDPSLGLTSIELT